MAPVFSKVAARNSAVIGASVGIVYWISTVLLRRGMKRALISEDIGQFRKNLEAFIFAMPMLSLLNNAIKLVLNKLRLSFRSRLTKHLFDQYLTETIYYKMSNIDNQISNPDQVLTQDVETFCASVTDLYSNVSKPLFEIIMFVQRLSSTIGAEGPILMMTYLLLAGLLLTRLSQHIEQMNMAQKKLEGLLRYVNSRIIRCSE